MKKHILILILLTFLAACKEEKKATEKEAERQTEAVETTEIDKELKVVINFKTDKADEFKLMLNNIKIDEFQRKNVHIIETVEPSSAIETINAKFGRGNIPNNFNINLGVKEQKSVEISSIELSFASNNLVIEGTKLDEFFNINKFINYDNSTGTLTTQKIEGKHYPAILAKRKLINFLNSK